MENNFGGSKFNEKISRFFIVVFLVIMSPSDSTITKRHSVHTSPNLTISIFTNSITSNSSNDFLLNEYGEDIKSLPLLSGLEESPNNSSSDQYNWDFIDCDSFDEFILPPPSIIDLPPPPLPPFLKEIGDDLLESWQKRSIIKSFSDEDENIKPEDVDVHSNALENVWCPLCSWSNGNNDTILKFTKYNKEEKTDKGPSSVTVWVLVGVAAVSAALGAVLMGLLLRCKRKDVVNICGKEPTSVPETDVEPNNSLGMKDSGFEFSLKKFRNCYSETGNQPSRSESVQNTYTESPYVNGEVEDSSTLYAEIGNPSDVMSGRSNCSFTNVYGFTTEPNAMQQNSCCHFTNCNFPSNQNSYVNTLSTQNNITSKQSSEPSESSGGSASTPSSAYYSDVSNRLAKSLSSKRKKKKRKFLQKNNRSQDEFVPMNRLSRPVPITEQDCRHYFVPNIDPCQHPVILPNTGPHIHCPVPLNTLLPNIRETQPISTNVINPNFIHDHSCSAPINPYQDNIHHCNTPSNIIQHPQFNVVCHQQPHTQQEKYQVTPTIHPEPKVLHPSQSHTPPHIPLSSTYSNSSQDKFAVDSSVEYI